MLKALAWASGDLVDASSAEGDTSYVCPRCLAEVDKCESEEHGAEFRHRGFVSCELDKAPGGASLESLEVQEEAFRLLPEDRWDLVPAPPPWERMRLWSPGSSPEAVDFHREWPRGGFRWHEQPFLFGSTLFGGRRLGLQAIVFGGQTVYAVFPKSKWASRCCAEILKTGLARRLADFRDMGAIAIELPATPPKELRRVVEEQFARFDISVVPGHVIEVGAETGQTWLYARRNNHHRYHVGVVSASSSEVLRPAALVYCEAEGGSLHVKTMRRGSIKPFEDREEVLLGCKHEELNALPLPAISFQLEFDKARVPRAFFRVEAPSSMVVPSATQVVRRRDGLFGCRYQVLLRNYRKEPWAVALVSLWSDVEPSMWEPARAASLVES